MMADGPIWLRALAANPLRTALSTLGVVVGVAALVAVQGADTLVEGRGLLPPDEALSSPVVVLNTAAADALGAKVGDSLHLGRATLTVVGIARAGGGLTAMVPLATFTALGLATDRLPILVVRAARLEDVPAVRGAAEGWLASWIGAAWPDAVQLQVNARRVAQAMQAMRVFRLLMGAITGITLLVGGIGIMNIMLASVLERTREIGVRRAAGARRRDILLQFVAEAVALAGGMLGIAVGFALATVAGAVMRSLTDAPIHIAFAWRTPAAALGAAAAVGVAFGLYPAQRAAWLAPADALRHE